MDMASHMYTHYPKDIDKTKKKTNEELNFLAEITHPQGKILISKSDNKEHLLIQNTQYPPLPKTKKRSKRALLYLDVDKVEDRFYEDGSIVHGTDRLATAPPQHCKVMVVQKENGGHELTVSFTSMIRPPQPLSQAVITETVTKKEPNQEVSDQKSEGESKNNNHTDTLDNVTVEVEGFSEIVTEESELVSNESGNII